MIADLNDKLIVTVINDSWFKGHADRDGNKW